MARQFRESRPQSTKGHWFRLQGTARKDARIERSAVCVVACAVAIACGSDSKTSLVIASGGAGAGANSSHQGGGPILSGGDGELEAAGAGGISSTDNRGGTRTSGGRSGAGGLAGSASGGERPSGGNGADGGVASGETGGTRGSSGQGSGGRRNSGGSAATGGGNGAAGALTGGSGSGGTGQTAKSCPPIQFETNQRVASTDTDRVTWADADCKPRIAALARVGGGYVRQFIYDVNGSRRVATGTGSDGQPGWGYPVDHFEDSYIVGHDLPGTFGAVFVGDHHLVYRYALQLPIAGQQVPVTLEWLFATGRSNPVVAVTYDLHTIAAGSLVADTRTPYGDLAWDGDDNASKTQVAGVGWGDRYRFVTTTAPLTLDSSWDYSKPNRVPYVLEWTTSPDAEMGAVQSQTYQQHDAGGYWFYSNWGKTSSNQVEDKTQVGKMPSTWNWTYQLCQYELCDDKQSCLQNTTGSHRLAWGSNYGAVGGAEPGSGLYNAYGDDRQVSGHPLQSYAVFMVLGKHSDAPTAAQVTEIENIQSTTLTARVGSVLTRGPAGVGVDDIVTLDPPGYDARRSAWLVDADQNRLDLTLAAGSGTLHNPILIVTHYSSEAEVDLRIDDQPALSGQDYLISRDRGTASLWVTLLGSWSGERRIRVQPLGS